MKKLAHKVIIVTGGSRGIGKEIALQLAKEGAKVVLNYVSNDSAALQTKEEIIALGGTVIIVKADVSKKEEAVSIFDTAISHFGQVDVLINNAAVMDNKALKDCVDDDFTKAFDVNVKGVFHMLQEASEKLADNGIILNFSSSTTRMMLPTYGIYSATKAAVEQMTKVFSKEVGRGISVNAIAPGPTKTDLFLEGKSEAFINELKGKNAFDRLAEPIDIANVVLLFCSDDSKWISGQVIAANGAMV